MGRVGIACESGHSLEPFSAFSWLGSVDYWMVVGSTAFESEITKAYYIKHSKAIYV